MRHAAITTQVDIPVIGRFLEPLFAQIRQEHLEPLLALAATDDLADARHEQVHRRDRLAVVVAAHVEGFDLFRVVVDRGGTAEMMFGQVTLVLGLKGVPILDRILEGLSAREEQRHRLGVGDALEGPVTDELEPLDEAFVDESVAEVKILRAVHKGVVDEILHHLLGQGHVSVEVAEGDLGLDHPELGGVARGVRVLGPEGGTKGVNVRQGAGEGLPLELAAHGQVGGLAEKLVAPRAHRFALHRHDAEHLAGTLAVGAGNDGGVHVDETALLKELMDRISHAAADAEDGAEEIRTWPEVGDRAHELHRVPLFLERVILGRGPDEDDARGLELPFLPLALRGDDGSLDLDRGSRPSGHDGLLVSRQARIGDDLEIAETTPVVQFKKGEGFRISLRPHPSLHGDVAGGGFAAQDFDDSDAGHAGSIETGRGDFKGIPETSVNCPESSIAKKRPPDEGNGESLERIINVVPGTVPTAPLLPYPDLLQHVAEAIKSLFGRRRHRIAIAGGQHFALR